MSFVAGIGSTNVDLLYENMRKIPAPGEEVYTDSFSLQLGGGLPATLINIGRLGIPARIATELGGDMFSSFASQQYEKNNVAPLNLYRGSKIPVNITSAIILKDDRSFVSYGKGDLECDDVTKEEFYRMASGAKICLMTPRGFTDVYRKLKEEGTTLVLDMGWDEELGFDKYGEFLDLADYYTPNRKEALKLTGRESPYEALRALKEHFRYPLVKVDKDGCLGIDDDGVFFCRSIDAFRNVDSTGAGDAFLAGLCYGLYYDFPFRECVKFGNVTGGKAVTAVGALSAYVTESELKEISKSVIITDYAADC